MVVLLPATWLWLVVVSLVASTLQAAESPIKGIRTEARPGQIFVMWDEGATPFGTTFNVYVASEAIKDVGKAKKVGHHVEQHSARDWWEDPATFDVKKTPEKPVGFRIGPGDKRLDPAGGLFVHTVAKGGDGKLFFAVTTSDESGNEERTLVSGDNATVEGVEPIAGPAEAIWQGEGEEPPVGAGKDKALWLQLHGKSGVIRPMEYLAFGDAEMGWREGLPFKFSAKVIGDEVVVRPTDRTWINRNHSEALDGRAAAIWSFWYGYNSNIYDPDLKSEGVPTNYTERRNLWMLDFVDRRYQPDRNRWYCSGGSMGGSGTISFGLRHPELFAAIYASVPIVSYTYRGRPGATSAGRIEHSCWTGPIPPTLKDESGVPFLDRMDAGHWVENANNDLPFVYIIHGRQDSSIPWQNNPPFYASLNKARAGHAVYWDNGIHSTSGKDAPPDVKDWLHRFRRFRLNESYPAFSNAALNRNPGDGRPEDGDIVGWINRGLDWRDIIDEPDRYSITLTADYPDIVYPVNVDVTLRRLQRFDVSPNETMQLRVGDSPPQKFVADAQGKITIPAVSIAGRDGIRILLDGRSYAFWRPNPAVDVDPPAIDDNRWCVDGRKIHENDVLSVVRERVVEDPNRPVLFTIPKHGTDKRVEKLHDELKRLVMSCNCRFIVQVATGHVRGVTIGRKKPNDLPATDDSK